MNRWKRETSWNKDCAMYLEFTENKQTLPRECYSTNCPNDSLACPVLLKIIEDMKTIRLRNIVLTEGVTLETLAGYKHKFGDFGKEDSQ